MLTLSVQFTIDPAHADEFEAISLKHAENSLAKESGCLQFSICKSSTDPAAFFFFEAYADAHALHDIHMNTSYLKEFRTRTTPWVVRSSAQEWVCANPPSHPCAK